MSEKNNFKIVGEGTFGGGEFDIVKVVGDTTIIGEVTANKIRITGEVEFLGKVKSLKTKIVGEAEFKDNAELLETKIVGEAEFKGDAQLIDAVIIGKAEVDGSYESNNTKLYGELKAKKDINCKNVKNKGCLSTKNNVTSERFESSGFCEIGGLLTAEVVKMNLQQKDSYIKEIGGTNIEVKRKFSFLKRDCKLTSESIEGDSVKLENTVAKVVRGKNIIIGKNCAIDLVEYSGSFIQSEDSTVVNVVKV